MPKDWSENSAELERDVVVDYRMDREGTLYVRLLGDRERLATETEIRTLLTTRPDLVLKLAWRC